MKINTNDFIVESNVNTPMQNFSISDMSLVMELLSKLYNNPRQTLTQEYISNARDANRESGTARPIEIKAPTLLDSTMVIRDFGLGISPDRMEKVFKSYGTSTKRDTNNQVGGFGIGSKSAFSYTDSFAITTFIDGIKRDYLAHKTAKAGGLTLLSEAPTSEANGTAISIAVKVSDLEIFRKAIGRTTFFWSKQEYPIITGMQIGDNDKHEEIVIDKTLSIYNSFPEYLDNANLVVIDGIPYPKPRDVGINKIRTNYIYRIPNSILNIAPSRESLVDNDYNLNTLKAIRTKLLPVIESYIKTVTSKDTFGVSDWLELNKLFESIPSKFGYTYSCQWHNDIVGYKDIDDIFLKVVFGRRGGNNFKNQFYAKANIDNLYYDDIKESRDARLFRFKKLNKDKGIYLLNNKIEQGLLDQLKKDLKAKPLSQIDVSDYVAPTKEARAQGIKKLANQVSVNYYPHNTLVRANIEVKDIKSGTVYISMEDNEYEKRSTSTLIDYLKAIKVEFIFVSKHTHERLAKEKVLIPLDTWVKNHKVSINEINSAIREVFGSGHWLQPLSKVKDQLKDNVLKSAVSYASLPAVQHKVVPKQFSDQIDNNKDYIAANKLKEYLKTIKVKYPLLPTLCYDFRNNASKEYTAHLVQYINSNARNKNV